MPDLQRFGKRLRELREGRGITQEEAVEKSETYSEASGLRKIERGDQRPKRRVIIALLWRGLEEQDPAKFDELLTLAGYQPLSDGERSEMGLSRPDVPIIPPAPLPATPVPASLISAAPLASAPLVRESPGPLRFWNVLSGGCLLASMLLAWSQGWFTGVVAALYAGLYIISVLLEAAYEFRGMETARAAAAAGSLVLATSLLGIWLPGQRLSADKSNGLGFAALIFITAAVLQWLIARPALPSRSIVPTSFQSHTAQSAHLKNTLYFLFAAAAFWILPRHCIETLEHRRGMLAGTFCPKPAWLWLLLLAVMAASLWMGSRVTESLKPGPRHNLYVNLYYARALLYFLFSVVCLAWYSGSYSELAAKFMISNSP